MEDFCASKSLSLPSAPQVYRSMFEKMVYVWRAVNCAWIQERTYFENGKLEYKHGKTRGVINSLLRNLPNLSTFENHPELDTLNTNTSNRIDGIHSELKRRLANHRGLKKEQKFSSYGFFSLEEHGCKYTHFCYLLQEASDCT